VTLYIEGFNRFVTSTIAPIATGWSESCRVGFAHLKTVPLHGALQHPASVTPQCLHIILHRRRIQASRPDDRPQVEHAGQVMLIMADVYGSPAGHRSSIGRRKERPEV
jgi:hypothetical protein